MPSKIRLQRIADRILEDLSEMLIVEIADPRVSGVTITEVRVDRELAFASIYVSAVEGKERSDEILTAFEHAKGYIRSYLAKRIELRTFPQLRFFWDEIPERADQIDRLINSLSKPQDEGN